MAVVRARVRLVQVKCSSGEEIQIMNKSIYASFTSERNPSTPIIMHIQT